MRSQITIHKLDQQGIEVWRYSGRILERSDHSISLEAHFSCGPVVVSRLKIYPGDRSVEVFYDNRWYNIFAIHDQQHDRLKGWYCNITRPARIEANDIYSEDLALDLIVYPDGKWDIVDEEEYAALELSAYERQQVDQALGELKILVKQRRGSFALIPPNNDL
jgi:protein associated with RNAse G/E